MKLTRVVATAKYLDRQDAMCVQASSVEPISTTKAEVNRALYRLGIRTPYSRRSLETWLPDMSWPFPTWVPRRRPFDWRIDDERTSA